jgi:hypothetical protein
MIKNFAASAKKPFFLAGDMTAEPQSDFIKGLQKDFQILSNPKVPTFPAPKPEETLDYIVTLKNNAKGFAAISSKVQDELVASDHRPLVVTLRTAEKAEKIFRTKPYLQNPVGRKVFWRKQRNSLSFPVMSFGLPPSTRDGCNNRYSLQIRPLCRGVLLTPIRM